MDDDFPSAYGHIYKKNRENGTVQSITPPVGSIKQNVYLHSDQESVGDVEKLSLFIYQDSH